MKYALAAALALAAACAPEVKKEDLAILESRIQNKALEDRNVADEKISKMQQDISRYDAVVKKVQLQADEVERTLTKFTKESSVVIGKVDVANTNVLKSLEIQEQYLKQLLESIRALIEDLKKK